MPIERGRVGQFFLLIGIVLLVIFFASDQSRFPQPGYFFIGLLVGGFGVYLIYRDWKPRPPSGRFRLFKRNRKKED